MFSYNRGCFGVRVLFDRNGRNLCVCFLAQRVSVDRLLDLKSGTLKYAPGSAADSFGTGYFLRSSFVNWKQNSL